MALFTYAMHPLASIGVLASISANQIDKASPQKVHDFRK